MERPIRFLHLEDDVMDAELAQTTLESAGISCEITLAQTSGEFKESLSRREYDIILADYSLPGYDGMSALHLVREHYPEIPFIFVSGSMGEDAAIEALTEGATDYVLKHKLSRLVPAVRRALQEAEIRRGRKRAGEQIKYQARLLRHVNDAIIAIDDQSRITTWNRAAEAMYGWSSEEVMGQDIAEILRSGLTHEQQAESEEHLKESTASRGETVHYHKDGRPIYVETSTISLTNEQKQIIGFVSVNRDVTERKRAAQEIESLAKFPQENIGPVLRFTRDGRLLYANPASRNLLDLWGCEIGERPPEEIQLIVYQTLVIPMRREIEIMHGDTIDALMFVPIVDKDYVNVYGRDITERKRAEEALREAEVQYRTLVEQIPAITYITTLGEFSRAIYISPQIRALGFTPEEWLTGLWVKQLHPDDREGVLAEVRQSQAQTAPFSLDYRILTRDGQALWYHDEAVIVHDMQGQPRFLQGIWLDITEKKLAERQIQYQADLLANVNDAIVASDENYTLTSWNKGAEILYGWKAEEVLGRNGLEIVQTKWSAADAEEMRQHIAEKGYWRGEATQVRRDGTRTSVEISSMVLRGESGQITGYVSVNRDITERKQAEEKIQRQLQRLSGLHAIDIAISSSFDIRVILDIVLQQALPQLGVDAATILLFNPNDQTIEYAASQGFRSDALHHTQLKLSEGYAGRAVRERRTIYIPDLLEAGGKLGGAMQSAKEDFVDYYGAPLIVKGEVKGVLEIYHRSPLHADPEWLESLETLAGQAAIAIDNAQLFENLQHANAELEQRVAKRTEELNQTNIELEHASRAKDEFLATMSHELRTPLNSILGLSETLLEQRRDPLSEYQQKSLQLIASSGQHLLELINDILDLSKIEAGKLDFYPQPLAVDEFCRSCLAFVKSQAVKKSITITYTSEATVSKLFADPRRLKQIVVNLLTNAVKFTPEHGSVTLQVSTDLEQDLIQFSVIDTGIGIAAEDLQRLFQPFVQADSSLNRQQEGTGLGLALVQRLTDLHGGSVLVKSEVGKGSRFTINLPCKLDEIAKLEHLQSQTTIPVSQQSEKAEVPLETSVPRGVVLLAEDNMPNILTIGEYLESHGFGVVVARDGLEAIEKAEKINPDIILMDIQMPAMNGLEAMTRLRGNARFTSIPIIALTALAMPGDRERCLQAGASEYLSKPVSLKQLVKLISSLIEQSR